MPIAIIFDLFHTLVSPEDQWPTGFRREYAAAETLGIDPEMLAAFWEGPGQDRYVGRPVVDLLRRAALDQGVVPTAQALASALDVYGRYHDRSLAVPRPEVVRGLLALAGEGYRTGLLSNADDREVAAWHRSPLSELVPVACFSNAIGVVKPDPAAYGIILGRLAADPESVVFVGDGGSGEFQGAREAGIRRIVCITGFGTVNGLRPHRAIADASVLADAVIPSVADLPKVLRAC